MKIDDEEESFEAYITFRDANSARSAHENYDGSLAEKSKFKTKLISSKNLIDEEGDYIPRLYIDDNMNQIQRKRPTAYWHIASYKDGKENIIKGTKCLKRKFGFIENNNIKKYGRGILVKAETKIQAAMLKNYIHSQEDIIAKIVPHRSFNTLKGVVYSRDLFDFPDQEILQMCPESVYEVKKLNGLNGAILLHFNTRYIPDFIDVEGSRIRVKKYKYKPRQCSRCFEFGHTSFSCQNNPRCNSCSEIHGSSEACGSIKCLNCGGNHPPTSKDCLRFKLEQDILEVAHNEFVSIGSAKRKVMGANQSQESSYASVVKVMKNKSTNNRNTFSYQSSAVRPEITDKMTRIHTSSKKSFSKTSKIPQLSKTTLRIDSEKTRKDPTQSSKGARSKTENQVTTKLQREDSDLDDFKLPNKRHRAQRSPKKSFDDIDIKNRFSVLSSGKNAQNQVLGQVSRVKSKSTIDITVEQDKNSITRDDLQKTDQNSSKTKLLKNFFTLNSRFSMKEQTNDHPE